ncbi:uncharacterized protein FIBRA_01842 [Fibroporia radiculosa]|uniref:Beta-lactamase-related domain-containing protein n=1 Tax=Fibroporia radiculosa TaxID=599839 RepID=J4G176_9APHY|nr:uncharacterized protein FIBRA_01842 [Fibroporia radiculosa]CCL99818.1 predicted protein [Fibroporia radiculosa]
MLYPLTFASIVATLAFFTAGGGPQQFSLDSILLSFPRPVHAAKHAITPELSQFIEDLLKAANIPGVALGIVRLVGQDKPVVEFEAWGRRTEGGQGHDISFDTLFPIASCSKAFLASAVGLLIDDFAQGRNVTPLPPSVRQFDWETKVADLLPDDWSLEDEWLRSKLTIRDALAHVSGMPSHDYSYVPGNTPRDVVKNLRNLRPAYELRRQWSYNNQMYMMGSHLIETYANLSYTDFVDTRLFTPMNMTSTTFWPNEANRDAKFTQLWTPSGRRIPYWFSEESIPIMAGMGGIISSAEDMAKWLGMLLNDGVDVSSNATVISHDALKAMTTAYAIVSGTAPSPEFSIIGYGMGWYRYSYQGHEIITHNGDIPGVSTRVAFLPGDGLGIVVLINASNKAAAHDAIMYRVIEDVLELRRIHRSVGANASVTDDPDVSVPRLPHTLDLEAYAGTYTNPGYGALTLCAPTSSSNYCAQVLADFAAMSFLPDTQTPNVSAGLYAAWPRVWSTHAHMMHRSADTFDLAFRALFTRGYGANTSAFDALDGIGKSRAVFVVDDGGLQVKGFAFVADENAAAARARHSNAVEEIADAWFERVH